jgi:hypothetical protein
MLVDLQERDRSPLAVDHVREQLRGPLGQSRLVQVVDVDAEAAAVPQDGVQHCRAVLDVATHGGARDV